jgi:hypothetical protein
MRARGMTVEEIAAELGCTRKVVWRALRKSADARTPSGPRCDWVASLPYRAKIILMREGYREVDQVRHAVNAGHLSPTVTHGLGPSTWKAICDWLDIDATERTLSPDLKPEDLEHARQTLERAGYRIIPPKNGLSR